MFARFRERGVMRDALDGWQQQGRIDAAAVARHWPQCEASDEEWRAWLDRGLLALGAALLAAGVVVFFAFNWQDLHKFAKFGLIVAGISALAWWAMQRNELDAPGQAALFVAQVLTGVLFAVIGQTYQSGADAWQLFALWALLAVPWALAARATPLWWTVLVLFNLALSRWLAVQVDVDTVILTALGWRGWQDVPLVLLTASVVQLILWFTLSARFAHWGLRGDTGARLLTVLATSQATWLGISGLIGSSVDGARPLLALVALLGLGAWYRYRHWDIFNLSTICLAVMAILTTALGRSVLHRSSDLGGFFFIGLALVGQAAICATWLMSLHRKQQTPAPAALEQA